MTCQVEFLDCITLALDRKLSAVVIYLDMTKAFDKVPHNLLLHKLFLLGIRPPLLDWFYSYLDNRCVSVKCNKVESQPGLIRSGVIQGSVLGPLLYLIFVNDIAESLQTCRAFIFADDMKLVFSFPPSQLNQAILNIQQDLRKLENWCDLWGMEFSTPKSSVICFRCCIPSDAIQLNGKTLSRYPAVKDLGIQYSESLRFTEQISYVTTKAKKTIGLGHSFVSPKSSAFPPL